MQTARPKGSIDPLARRAPPAADRPRGVPRHRWRLKLIRTVVVLKLERGRPSTQNSEQGGRSCRPGTRSPPMQPLPGLRTRRASLDVGGSAAEGALAAQRAEQGAAPPPPPLPLPPHLPAWPMERPLGRPPLRDHACPLPVALPKTRAAAGTPLSGGGSLPASAGGWPRTWAAGSDWSARVGAHSLAESLRRTTHAAGPVTDARIEEAAEAEAAASSSPLPRSSAGTSRDTPRPPSMAGSPRPSDPAGAAASRSSTPSHRPSA